RGSLLPVVEELARRGWCTKRSVTRQGRVRGGRPFTKGSLYQLLTNVTYVGRVRYRQEGHPGEQPAIVDRAVWEHGQARLAETGRARRVEQRSRSRALLQGLLRCRPCGCAMTPAHVTNGNKRYRYYTCSAAQKKGWHTCPSKSVSAVRLERYVLEQIAPYWRGRGRATPKPRGGAARVRQRRAGPEHHGTRQRAAPNAPTQHTQHTRG